MNILAIGAILNSALFYAGVFFVGLIWGNHVAVILALVGFGSCYLSYMAQALAPQRYGLNAAITGLAIGIGLGALATLALSL